MTQIYKKNIKKLQNLDFYLLGNVKQGLVEIIVNLHSRCKDHWMCGPSINISEGYISCDDSLQTASWREGAAGGHRNSFAWCNCKMRRPAMRRVDQLHYSDVLDSVAQGRGQDCGRAPLFTVPRTCCACSNCMHYYHQLADQYYFCFTDSFVKINSRARKRSVIWKYIGQLSSFLSSLRCSSVFDYNSHMSNRTFTMFKFGLECFFLPKTIIPPSNGLDWMGSWARP